MIFDELAIVVVVVVVVVVVGVVVLVLVVVVVVVKKERVKLLLDKILFYSSPTSRANQFVMRQQCDRGFFPEWMTAVF